MKKLVTLRGLMPLLLLLTFTGCKDDSGATCEKDLLAKVRPDSNPAAAPVLIRGKNFSARTKVFFNDIEAESSFINDSTLTTHVPGSFQGKEGTVEVQLRDQVCLTAVPFRVSLTFKDYRRASPPDIYIPVFSEKSRVNLFNFKNGQRIGRLVNIWSDIHFLSFEQVTQTPGNGNIVSFTGTEEIFYPDFNAFTGTYSLATNNIEINIERGTSAIVPQERLVGAFYNSFITTQSGYRKTVFLLLESTVTGRQYIFE